MEKNFKCMNEKGEWEIVSGLNELINKIKKGEIKELEINDITEDEMEKIQEAIKKENLNYRIEQRYLLDLVRKSFLKIVR